MPEENILKQLRETFPKATKDDWKRAASQEIDGKDPMEMLGWNIADHVTAKAYYDSSDSLSLEYLKNFQLPTSSDPLEFPRTWVNLPKITVTNSATANQIALNHLQQGAEGILFDFTDRPDPEIESLLEKIEWPYCSISFQIAEKNISLLADYITDKNYTPDSLTGTIFWEKPLDNAKNVIDTFTHQKKINALGLIISPASPTHEISDALTRAVSIVDQLTSKGVSATTVIQNIAFSLPVGTNFFLEIAKLKALRMLWFQVVRAYGEEKYSPVDLHIHARSEAWINEKFQPQGSLLKSTTASMAAVLGGCDSLTVDAEDENNPMMNRMARNVSTILREESHLNKVADAVTGSYAIDSLVHEIAKQAWIDFQIKSKQS